MDEHNTKLTEQEMLEARVKRIIDDFSRLPKEQQERIVKRIAGEVQGEIMAVGAQFLEALKESGTAFAKSLADAVEKSMNAKE